MRKTIGYLILASGIMGIVLSMLALIFGLNWMDRAETDLEDTLALVSITLDTAGATLDVAGNTTASIAKAFDSVQRTLITVSKGLNQTTPIIKSVREVTANTIPQSLDLAITAVDGVASAARSIDGTLNDLADLQIELPLIGAVNLSLATAPDPPLYEPVEAISTSLQTVSDRLNTLDTTINSTQNSVYAISADLNGIAAASRSIQDDLEDVGPIVASYAEIIGDLQARIDQADTSQPFSTARIILVLLVVWLELSQLTALVVGWTLIQPRGEGLL